MILFILNYLHNSLRNNIRLTRRNVSKNAPLLINTTINLYVKVHAYIGNLLLRWNLLKLWRYARRIRSRIAIVSGGPHSFEFSWSLGKYFQTSERGIYQALRIMDFYRINKKLRDYTLIIYRLNKKLRETILI